jgi:hypothetical protein
MLASLRHEYDARVSIGDIRERRFRFLQGNGTIARAGYGWMSALAVLPEAGRRAKDSVATTTEAAVANLLFAVVTMSEVCDRHDHDLHRCGLEKDDIKVELAIGMPPRCSVLGRVFRTIFARCARARSPMRADPCGSGFARTAASRAETIRWQTGVRRMPGVISRRENFLADAYVANA